MSTAITAPAGTERQILVRVDRAVRVGERELRYQLDRKDNHPLAQSFRLTAEGRARLAGLDAEGWSA